MSGIITATKNFQSPRTSSLAFEMAGVLLRNGARREYNRTSGQQNRSPQQFGYRPKQSQNQPRTKTDTSSQSQNQQREQQIRQQLKEFQREKKGDEAPPDWLEPKIYKGSTDVE